MESPLSILSYIIFTTYSTSNIRKKRLFAKQPVYIKPATIWFSLTKKARENASLSQQDVADSLNISRQSVSKWERGISYPDIENLVILSDLYNISIDFLLKDNNETLVNEASKEIIQKNSEDKNEDFQNTYKSFAIIATTLLSCMVPLIGIILNLGIIVFCIIKKEKLPSWVWMILIVCLFINFVNTLIVLDGYFF